MTPKASGLTRLKLIAKIGIILGRAAVRDILSRLKNNDEMIEEETTVELKTRTLENLKRWEALDMVFQAHRAMTSGKVGSACVALGMGDDLGPMTIEEIFDAINVRFATVAKAAGIDIEQYRNMQ